MRRSATGLVLAALLVLAAAPAPAAPRLADLPIDVANRDGKVMASFPRPGADGVAARLIYVTQLETGLGSASIVLDRGVSSASRLLVFRRVGDRLVAEVENPRFVAPSGTAEEQRSVAEGFATSVLWIGKIATTHADGRFEADLAPFLLRDDMNIAQALKKGDGDWKFAPDLSVVDAAATRRFPSNAELSVRLGFKADEAKPEIANIAPDSGLISLAMRHSFVALPLPGYTLRHDPYGYGFGPQQVDASAPLGQPMVRDLLSRFRLERADPADPRSPVRDPITFYIDRAAPEPVRSALVDGVGWWRDSFARAGLPDAFRVAVLPDGADPLDVRYNVVNWVNRATRGWSYGGPAIADPRTGEILKGTVQLGSLRVRQDILIFQALVGAGLTGTGGPDDPITAALARIRQLGAHEVGHALGFNHNFAASSQQRYSVMDYPAPRVLLGADGRVSLADAYGQGTGRWDDFLVAYSYGAQSDAEAATTLARARAEGLRFVGDGGARGFATAHPDGALWDDGGDPLAEFARVMAVRRAALARFAADALPAAAPRADLKRAFVPVWLLHRYQAEAVAKLVGGVRYAYALAGEVAPASPVPGADQQAALDALLAALSPDALRVPDRLLPLLTAGFNGNPDRQSEIELMPTAGDAVFDPLAATEVGAAHILLSLLNPDRLDRLELQHQADPSVPSAHQLVARLFARTIGDPRRPGDALQRRIATTAILAVARAARQPALSPALAPMLDQQLRDLAADLARARGRDAAGDWARGMAALLADREALDKAIADPARLPQVPPGMPI